MLCVSYASDKSEILVVMRSSLKGMPGASMSNVRLSNHIMADSVDLNPNLSLNVISGCRASPEPERFD